MSWILGICATAIAVGALATWRAAAGEGWRWGSLRSRGPQVGAGPYRSAPALIERRRRLPAVAAIASTASVAWGLVTLLILSPLGLALTSWAVPAARDGVLLTIAALAMVAVTMSGFPMAVRLMAVCRSLAVRTDRSAEHALSVAVHAAVHHGLALATFGFMGLAVRRWELLRMAAIPCAIGFAVAALLARAHRAIRRIDRQDAQARDTALPA